MPNSQLLQWLEKRKMAANYQVSQIPFSEFSNWGFRQDEDCLAHSSGRFFQIRGIEVQSQELGERSIFQPIIFQPEIGILGIVTKRFNGVLHCLMQAKIEPGNVNGIQISPTVQATKSNYMQVHKGARPRYLDFFVTRGNSRVVFDQLQSEQNSFFYKKRNRNIIIETGDDIEVHEDFCWLTIGQLKYFMKFDNIVNMDTRSVLSGICFSDHNNTDKYDPELIPESDFGKDLWKSIHSDSKSLHTMIEILSWFTDQKTKQELNVKVVGLSNLKGWTKTPNSIQMDDGKYFSVIGTLITTSSREVSSWTQPLIKTTENGLNCFITKNINGVLHFLVQAKSQPGCMDNVELAPTVQYLPGDPFLNLREDFAQMLQLTKSAQKIMMSSIQSEEGGRFYHYQNENKIVQIESDQLSRIPDNYIWMTLNQMLSLIQYSNIFNMEARSLLACLHFS